MKLNHFICLTIVILAVFYFASVQMSSLSSPVPYSSSILEGYSNQDSSNTDSDQKKKKTKEGTSKPRFSAYNHNKKTQSLLTPGERLYNEDGGEIVVEQQSDGTQQLKVTLKPDTAPMFLSSQTPPASSSREGFGTTTTTSSTSTQWFYGPGGASADVVQTGDGNKVEVSTSKGKYQFTHSLPVRPAYKDEGGGGGGGQNKEENKRRDKSKERQQQHSMVYPASHSLDDGIPRSMIPPGKEDLYILKSQIVPPICPMCPATVCPTIPRQEPCPACPPCGRCPDAAFDCKKVPNYEAMSPSSVPTPMLTNFSTFGM